MLSKHHIGLYSNIAYQIVRKILEKSEPCGHTSDTIISRRVQLTSLFFFFYGDLTSLYKSLHGSWTMVIAWLINAVLLFVSVILNCLWIITCHWCTVLYMRRLVLLDSRLCATLTADNTFLSQKLGQISKTQSRSCWSVMYNFIDFIAVSGLLLVFGSTSDLENVLYY